MDEPGVRLRQLAERVGIERAAAERSVARLEQRGLIMRTLGPSKSHLWLLSPTPEGIEMRLKLRAAVIVAQDRLMAPLSDQERETLKNLLERVVEANASRAPG